MKIVTMFSLLILCMVALTGCERDSAVMQAPQLTASDPDRFARFVDEQQSLAAGTYRVIATTLNTFFNQPGSYQLTITKDDGSSTTVNGGWANSPGVDFDVGSHDIANQHAFTLDVPGGINITMQSDNDPFFFIVDANDNVVSNTGYIDSQNVPRDIPWITESAVGNNTVMIDLPANISESVYYARAYYDAIDPDDTRDTLYKWREQNCFTNDPASNYGADAHVVFRDTRDLGYGRSMYWKFGCDGNKGEDAEPGAIAVFVENFDVEALPGFPYSTLNLQAVLNNQRQYHFGTNAIAFNTWSAGNTGVSATNPLGRQFAKFYTFRPVSAAVDADEIRLDMVDLDGRGDKAMPLPCIYCHGGRGLALQADGSLYAHPQTAIAGDTNAKLQILDVDSLEFAGSGEFTRASQETLLKQLNQAMYCTYPPETTPAAICDNLLGTSFTPPAPLPGEWDGKFMRELVQGWYGGDATDDSFPAAGFDGSQFVPAGWDPDDPANAANPPDIDVLFLEVIKPSCLVCHARRGNTINSDIDFSSYDKFISHADRLEDYLYSRGIMPLSQIGFDAFWNSSQPETLARFLPDFSHVDSDGNIIPPGQPVAVLGPDRVVNTPVTLNGLASQFAESYDWSIVSTPPGATASLTPTDSARVSFDTDTAGVYEIRLTVSQGENSATDTMLVTVDQSLKAPASLGFADDIVPIIGSNADGVVGSQGCDTCHYDTDAATAGIQGGSPGIPAVWDTSAGTIPYNTVLARVNLTAPHDSPFLRKPLGKHHGGGVLYDLTLPDDLKDYNTVLTWITEGAKP